MTMSASGRTLSTGSASREGKYDRRPVDLLQAREPRDVDSHGRRDPVPCVGVRRRGGNAERATGGS